MNSSQRTALAKQLANTVSACISLLVSIQKKQMAALYKAPAAQSSLGSSIPEELKAQEIIGVNFCTATLSSLRSQLERLDSAPVLVDTMNPAGPQASASATAALFPRPNLANPEPLCFSGLNTAVPQFCQTMANSQQPKGLTTIFCPVGQVVPRVVFPS